MNEDSPVAIPALPLSRAGPVEKSLRARDGSPGAKTGLHDLSDWLRHRAGLLSLSWPQGVSEISGVPVAALNLIQRRQTLRGLGRSARGYLARALKVSVRELEAIGAGRIDWIADNRVLDLDRLTPNSARPIDRAAGAAVASSLHCGVPILGRILETGLVEHFDGWTPEDGRRIAVRYPGVPDAFALELEIDLPPYVAGGCLVFQTIPPGEVADGEFALLTSDETELRVAYRDGSMSLRTQPIAATGRRLRVIAMCDILRAARVIDYSAPRSE
jgi:hypothetical protein